MAIVNVKNSIHGVPRYNHLSEMREKEINRIIEECEDLQRSNESSFTKEQAKISAYNEIKEVLGW